MKKLQIKRKAARIAALCLLILAGQGLAAAAEPLPGRDAGGSFTMGTRSGEAYIGSDPATGDRIMITPERREREDQQSYPIFVAPEINLPGHGPGQGGWPPGPGGRPPWPPKQPR